MRIYTINRTDPTPIDSNIIYFCIPKETIFKPSNALSTDIAGVITPSPNNNAAPNIPSTIDIVL